MKSSIIPFVLGILIGITFQRDIPFIKNIDFEAIRGHIMKTATKESAE
jgi:hypothetical protein